LKKPSPWVEKICIYHNHQSLKTEKYMMKPIHNVVQSALALCLAIFVLTACSATDDAVIKGNPRDYLLKPADLPSTSFYIPETDAFSIPNEMAVSAFGKEKAGTMIQEEERVTAWRVHYQANTADQPGPQVYVVTITQHQSAKGAKTAVEKYNSAALYPDGGWKLEANAAKVGDTSLAEIGPTEDAQGQKLITYRIEFAYRNMSADVLVYGLEKEVSLTTVEKAATDVLRRLQSAPTGRGPIPTAAVTK
jgi:hypothetical protein